MPKRYMNVDRFTTINGIAVTAVMLALLLGGLNASIVSTGAVLSVVMAPVFLMKD